MTAPDRIDHAAEARDWITDAPMELSAANLNAGTPERAALCASLAQAHAVLALVEQQRIANLIALTHKDTYVSDRAYLALVEGPYPEGAVLRPDIAAALGVSDE